MLFLLPYHIQVVVVHMLDSFQAILGERPCKLLGRCESDWSSSV